MHAFLLIGQSNMAGRGYLNEAHPIDTTRIYTLRNGRWHKMFRPINPDRRYSGVCLGESFAEQYAKKYDVDVGLICCADGGTSLDQWQPGELLFENAVYQAKLAKRTAQIVGVLWHQGESDCTDTLYPTYQARFETMMRAFQKELELYDVPFILGGLGDFLAECPLDTNLKKYTYVNDALKSIARDNKMVGFASAQGLTANGDNLHFNADSLYEFGLRYFAEFDKLRKGDSIPDTIENTDTMRTKMELL